jgi:hypothetical protein
MSDRSPSFFPKFVKWLVVPLSLAAVGVFAVGPYLNKVGLPIPGALKPHAPTSAAQQPETPDVSTDAAKFGEPQLEVKVSPVRHGARRRGKTLAATSRHRHRRHRKSAIEPHAGTDRVPPKDSPDNSNPTPPDDTAGA